jgi:protein O-GlcNAc transferase
MDLERFAGHLAAQYDDWGQPSVRPRTDCFQGVLNRVQGLTSPNVLQLLNVAVGCLEGDEVYGEVGTFQGATLIGALLGHRRRAWACDNFSEFDPQGLNHTLLLRNLERFGLRGQVDFRNQDFEEFLSGLSRSGPRVGVYLYDGAHDYRAQMLGLLLAVPLLAERALLVVDDSNWPAVQQATWDFMLVRRECRLLFDLPTPRNGDPTWWNGLMVLAWQAGSDNGYDRAALGAARQPALLESLSCLQLVHLQREGNTVRMRPAP